MKVLDEAEARSGWVQGVGTLDAVDLVIGEHGPARRLNGPLELAALSGPVGRSDGAITVRLNAMLSRDRDTGLETVGGRLAWARATAGELHVVLFEDSAVERPSVEVVEPPAPVSGRSPIAPSTAGARPSPVAHLPAPSQPPPAPVAQPASNVHAPPVAQFAPSVHAAPVAQPPPVSYSTPASISHSAPAPQPASASHSAPSLQPTSTSRATPASPYASVSHTTPAPQSVPSARLAASDASPPASVPRPATIQPEPFSMPTRPVKPQEDLDNYPEIGDNVTHFHFGECTVIGSDGDRIRLRQERDGRVREVALTMLRIEAPTETPTGGRHFKLGRKN